MKIFKFTAPWCGQCKVLSKKLEKFDACEIVSFDVEEEENEPLIEKYNIKNLPLLVLVNDKDEEVKRWCGIVDANEIKKEIGILEND